MRIVIAALVTRILRRVIVRLAIPISLSVIADITSRDFMRGICAISQSILAYRYTANNDAQLSARYIAYGDVTFGVRHMRFKPGALAARYSPYKAGCFDVPLLYVCRGDFRRHYFNNFNFHLQSCAIQNEFHFEITLNFTLKSL